MQHFLDGSCMMSSLDNFQSDALANSHWVIVEFELVLELVDGEIVHFLKLVVYAFLQFLVLKKGNQRISVFRSKLLFLLLFFVLHYIIFTSFIGSRY